MDRPPRLGPHEYLIRFACGMEVRGELGTPWAAENLARERCPVHDAPRVAVYYGKEEK